jgi:hypothetical protein
VVSGGRRCGRRETIDSIQKLCALRLFFFLTTVVYFYFFLFLVGPKLTDGRCRASPCISLASTWVCKLGGRCMYTKPHTRGDLKKEINTHVQCITVGARHVLRRCKISQNSHCIPLFFILSPQSRQCYMASRSPRYMLHCLRTV